MKLGSPDNGRSPSSRIVTCEAVITATWRSRTIDRPLCHDTTLPQHSSLVAYRSYQALGEVVALAGGHVLHSVRIGAATHLSAEDDFNVVL